MQIGQDFVEKALGLYQPELRFLVSVDKDDLVYKGKFNVDGKCHYLDPQQPCFDHVTAIEQYHCISQLSFVSIADLMENDIISTFSDTDFLEIQKNGILLIESNERFPKNIPRGEFSGMAEIDGIYNNTNLTAIDFKVDLNEGSTRMKYRILMKE